MTRPLFVALVAATALASAPALAQQQQPAAPQMQEAPAAQMQADPEALLDARIAGLRAGLRLTGDQEALFEPVEQAMRDAHHARTERREREITQDPAPMLDYLSALERRTAVAAARTQEQVQLVEALRPLWNSLDEGQRATLPVLLRIGAMQEPMVPGAMMQRQRMLGPARMRDRDHMRQQRMMRREDRRGSDRAR